jgi:hypothetical protein
MTEKTHPVYVGVSGRTYSVTPRQEDLLWKMQHGRSLEFYRVIGESHFVLMTVKLLGLSVGTGEQEFVNKGTVNSLIKRGLIVLDRTEGKHAHSRRSFYRVNPNPPAEKMAGVLRDSEN